MVLIQKYGGWYADLDIVFLKSLHTFEQGVLGCDNVPAETKELVNINLQFHEKNMISFFREINRKLEILGNWYNTNQRHVPYGPWSSFHDSLY